MLNNQDNFEKLKKIVKDIKGGNISPFYYVYGNEHYFINNIIKLIKNNFVDNSGINIINYDNDSFNIEEVTKTINNLPLMNDKKLIILKDVKFFTNKSEKNKYDAFIKVMDESKDINIVVIINYENEYKYEEKYKASNKFIEYISNNGVVFNSSRISENDSIKYLSNYFNKKEIKIDKMDVAYFVKRCGKNLQELFIEADKLIDSVGDKDNITKSDIDNIIEMNINDNVYNLIDAINQNNKSLAFSIYGDILSEGYTEHGIMSILSKNYEDLIYVKDLSERSFTFKDIVGKTGIKDYRLRKIIDANKGLNKETLLNKISFVTEMLYKNMKGEINPSLMIERLFY